MTFVEILQQFGIEYRQSGEHHHAREGWIQLDCPFCSKNWKHFRLGYNVYGGYCTCWSCGYHRTIDTLVEITEEPYKVIAKSVEGLTKDVIPAEFAVRGKYEQPDGVGKLLRQHKEYLRSRGFNPKNIQKLWRISGMGRLAKYPWRVFIPIHYRSEPVSWTTRLIGEGTPRYLSAPPSCERYPHKSLLYGEDYCRSSIVVCEGPLDVWKIGPGAVATCGTGFSRAQVLRIAKYSVRAICLDATKEGQIMAEKLVRQLSALPGETFNVVLDSKDAGEATERELKRIRKRFLQT